MTALAGYFGIVLAMASAFVLALLGLRGMHHPHRVSRRHLELAVFGLMAGGGLAFLALELGLLADDFSVAYIADHSATTTPFVYKLATGWAALEGSIVLWGLVLVVFTLTVYLRSRRDKEINPLWVGALGIMGLITLYFFGLMATIANPFQVCVEAASIGCLETSNVPWATAMAPLEGPGPNPLLQNHPLMAVHPPLLYIGYVGMTVPFAFAISALIRGESGAGWLRQTRSWTLVAWSFLTAGIVIGGLWSYEVLGWGGYWAWDPVENASFMPWLVATAFIHSSVVQQRRGMLQAWNFILVIATFSLTILGTFLTRSGIIASVHSFTQSPIGPALLWFLMVILVGSLSLFATRIHLVASSPRLTSLASREGVFLLNNLLLTVFAFIVLIGTLYPMFAEAVSGSQLGVGRPFFDRLAIPISFALLLAMGLGPITPFRQARGSVVWERIRNPLRVALAAGAGAVLFGNRDGYLVLGVVAGTFVISVILRQLWVTASRAAAKQGTPVWRSFWRTMRSDPGYWGGQLSHIGVALLAMGIAISANQGADTQLVLEPGQTAQFAGHEITYLEDFERDEVNRLVLGARVEVTHSGNTVVLEPRLNRYARSSQPVATPSVDTSLRGDFYLSLTGIGGGRISLDVFWFPFIWLIWVGGVLAAAAGMFSLIVKKPARVATGAEEESERV
ncbi:MAG: heme lyase CcmF/NrfE family subunit [Acidimicrobiia bacterium]|nr:heme lyase CcmF/NrfE family subunit [Acidimicrobiia bacterium]MBT8194763.1 heme lyase CcmF/NrfE family subunit [Acidimicrobiia bacterium]NNF87090.1 heme lyase CcmF/NrfE family subunit [Acidimicrobiia bacterium]NNL14810.1 heme lyase CcmF/NrfE family subunit [Acidimicrobiia bacterium]NNL97207.1 heme lyase CcmF/NrfE family subunit [Acidimicrobiia bacterium]